jgi:hypothetical protein
MGAVGDPGLPCHSDDRLYWTCIAGPSAIRRASCGFSAASEHSRCSALQREIAGNWGFCAHSWPPDFHGLSRQSMADRSEEEADHRGGREWATRFRAVGLLEEGGQQERRRREDEH